MKAPIASLALLLALPATARANCAERVTFDCTSHQMTFTKLKENLKQDPDYKKFINQGEGGSDYYNMLCGTPTPKHEGVLTPYTCPRDRPPVVMQGAEAMLPTPRMGPDKGMMVHGWDPRTPSELKDIAFLWPLVQKKGAFFGIGCITVDASALRFLRKHCNGVRFNVINTYGEGGQSANEQVRGRPRR